MIKQPFVEIYISDDRRMRIEPKDIDDVYLLIMFLQNSFLEQKECAGAQEQSHD